MPDRLSPARVLAIDTACGQCAVAIADEAGLVALRAEPMARGHDAALAPMVAQLLEEAALAPRTLQRVVVTAGPGSFTGVRIGLAFARAFALAIGAPCLGVSTLRAFAGEGGGERGAAMTAPDALFVALYKEGEEIVSPRRIALAEAPLLAAQWPAAQWRGPAAAAFGGEASGAVDIGALALAARGFAPTAFPPDPLYLRAPDAALPKE